MQELFYGSATDTLLLEVTDNGVLVAPTNVNVKVYNEAGVETASGTAITVSDDKRIRYAPGVATTAALGIYNRAEWKVTVNGIVRDMVTIFSVVKTKLVTDTNDEDLVEECPALDDSNAVFYGEAVDATTTSVIDPRLSGRPDDEWRGGTIHFLTGTYAGYVREVSASTNKAGLISWVDPLAAATVPPADPAVVPADGDEFMLRRSFKDQINRAWVEICEAVYAGTGYRPALILNPELLKTPCVYRALEKICRGLSNDPNDIWWARATDYYGKYERAFKNIPFLYDDLQQKIPTSERKSGPRFGR